MTYPRTGELAEIRAADLRFSERETRELLDAAGITLSEAGAARAIVSPDLEEFLRAY